MSGKTDRNAGVLPLQVGHFSARLVAGNDLVAFERVLFGESDEPSELQNAPGGYGLVFAAPRTASLLACFGGKTARDAVFACHKTAVTAAFNLLEDRLGDLIASVVEHRQNSIGDPHLHTHLLVFRVVMIDGEWTQVDEDILFASFRKAVSIYQQTFRSGLSETLGSTWTAPNADGDAEISGFPAHMIDAHSRPSAPLFRIDRCSKAPYPRPESATQTFQSWRQRWAGYFPELLEPATAEQYPDAPDPSQLQGQFTPTLIVGDRQVHLAPSFQREAVLTVLHDSEADRWISTDADLEVMGALHNPSPAPFPGNKAEVLRYETTLSVARDRLDVLGFTADKAQEIFDALVDGVGKSSFRDVSTFDAGGFDLWVNRVEDMADVRDAASIHDVPMQMDSAPGWSRYSLLEDVRFLLRSAAGLLPGDTKVTYLAALETPVQDLVQRSNEMQLHHLRLAAPTVVLTEGKTDSRLLNLAMRVLYPHLVPYYQFLDFDLSKSQGGASHVVQALRNFIGSAIPNRVIAIADNDAAARDAFRILEPGALPLHARVMHYPDIELARTYPTEGPAGVHPVDINGQAASLELYLGRDVLADESGALRPIRWGAHQGRVGAWQGEITGKELIQAAFEHKCKAVLNGDMPIEEEHWQDVRAILDCIRSAFV